MSEIQDTNPMRSIIGKCTVLYFTDYCKSKIQVQRFTVEPPNNGHIGTFSVVPCREVVLILEVNLHTECPIGVPII